MFLLESVANSEVNATGCFTCLGEEHLLCFTGFLMGQVQGQSATIVRRYTVIVAPSPYASIAGNSIVSAQKNSATFGPL